MSPWVLGGAFTAVHRAAHDACHYLWASRRPVEIHRLKKSALFRRGREATVGTVLNRGPRAAGTNVSESFTHWAKNRATQVDRVFFKVMPQAARNAAGELNVLD
jgi:hypothetical protein